MEQSINIESNRFNWNPILKWASASIVLVLLIANAWHVFALLSHPTVMEYAQAKTQLESSSLLGMRIDIILIGVGLDIALFIFTLRSMRGEAMVLILLFYILNLYYWVLPIDANAPWWAYVPAVSYASAHMLGLYLFAELFRKLDENSSEELYWRNIAEGYRTDIIKLRAEHKQLGAENKTLTDDNELMRAENKTIVKMCNKLGAENKTMRAEIISMRAEILELKELEGYQAIEILKDEAREHYSGQDGRLNLMKMLRQWQTKLDRNNLSPPEKIGLKARLIALGPLNN